MSTLVNSRWGWGEGGQNWSKFGPRRCWMPPCVIVPQKWQISGSSFEIRILQPEFCFHFSNLVWLLSSLPAWCSSSELITEKSEINFCKLQKFKPRLLLLLSFKPQTFKPENWHFQGYFIGPSDCSLFFSYWIGVEKKITNYTTYDYEWINGNTGDEMDYTLIPLHSRRSPKKDTVSTETWK